MRISDWSSDVCSSDLGFLDHLRPEVQLGARELRELVGPHVGGLSAAALGAGLEIVALDRRLRRGAQGRDRALGRSGRRVEAEPGHEPEPPDPGYPRRRHVRARKTRGWGKGGADRYT